MSDGKISLRRRFLLIGAATMGGIGVVAGTVPFVTSMLPSARTRAAGAPVDVDVSKIEPGMQVTVRVAREAYLGPAPHGRNAGQAWKTRLPAA
jgi:Rieske Fe-S protein